MLITATPFTSAQGPAQPGLKLPLHQGWWQEVSDGVGKRDHLPFPLHEAEELWAQENVMLSNQSHAVQLSRAVCGDLLGTARGAVWPQMGYSSHSFKIFQERNEVSCYDLVVFSWQLTSHLKAEGSCSFLVCAVSLLPGDCGRLCVGAARLQHCAFPPRAGSA